MRRAGSWECNLVKLNMNHLNSAKEYELPLDAEARVIKVCPSYSSALVTSPWVSRQSHLWVGSSERGCVCSTYLWTCVRQAHAFARETGQIIWQIFPLWIHFRRDQPFWVVGYTVSIGTRPSCVESVSAFLYWIPFLFDAPISQWRFLRLSVHPSKYIGMLSCAQILSSTLLYHRQNSPWSLIPQWFCAFRLRRPLLTCSTRHLLQQQ